MVAESLPIPGGYGVVARLWATCRALTAKLLSAMNRSASDIELYSMKARIVSLVLRSSSCTRAAWDGVQEGADAAAGLFAILAVCCPNASRDSMQASLGAFERLERAEAQRGREASVKSWSQWVATALKGGAGRAHRWTNSPNALVVDVKAPGSTSPLTIAQHHSNIWAKQWRADDPGKVGTAFAAVQALRERALKHPQHGAMIEQFTPSNLRACARLFRKNTSIGADAISFQDIIEATDESLTELCQIMQDCVRELVVPIQTLLVLVSLLGKKMGGTRCIAICATFYRLLMAVMKKPVRAWDLQVGLEGDSALPGRSPLEETAWRHLCMEQAVLRGKFVAQMLWDMAKFFDSLDIPELLARCEELDFPTDQLVLAMQVHRAPRALRAAGSYGDPIEETGASILAGCTLSTSLSRGFLRGPVRGACHSKSSASCSASQSAHSTNQHVDDVSQVVIGDTEAAVVARSRLEGSRIANAFVNSGLTISPKSMVTASSKRLANLVASALGRAGQAIEPVAAAEDLGVSTACGARRVVGALKKRLARGLARSKKVRSLVRINSGASKLYATGVRPQQSYGGSVIGVAPSQIRIMRRAAVCSASSAGAQPCTATIIAWRLGPQSDPAVTTPLEQVRLWMRLWARADKKERKEMRGAWARALPRILLGGLHWERVSGPLQATIAVLGQVGWHPVEPNRWIDASGTEYAELEWSSFANTGILDRLTRAFETCTWTSASGHYLGGGLESGIPTLDPARAARKWFLKQERWKEVKALDCVVCGGVWAEHRHGGNETCSRCGAQDVGAYHRYWSCPELGSITDEAVSRTQWMRSLFDSEYVDLQCLWGRGILPAKLLANMTRGTSDSIQAVATPGFQELVKEHCEAYTDGSGGPRWVPASAQVVGSAVATLKVRVEQNEVCVADVGVLIATAPGRPTVPRAELWAAILAAREAPENGDIKLYVDAAYVFNGIGDTTKQAALKAGLNGDLWTLLLDVVQAKSLRLSTSKVKGHAEKQILRGQVSLRDFLGNVLADAGAGAAAEAAIDTAVAQHNSLWESRAFLIAKRLAVIEASLWQDGPRLVPMPEPSRRIQPPTLPVAASILQKSIDNMGHKLHNRGAFVHCSRCRRHRKAASFRFWSTTTCEPVPVAHADGFLSSLERSVDPHQPTAQHDAAMMVTLAKRRRLLSAQRAMERQDIQAAEATRQHAWGAVARTLACTADESPEATQQHFRPAPVHHTHACIECGGFIGCTRCGSVSSTPQKSALDRQCRGWCPPGSRGPVKRLAAGALPHGQEWPSGATDPKPKRFRSWGVVRSSA